MDLIGDGLISLDMPYQSDLALGQAVADFLVAAWSGSGSSEASMQFVPRDDDELDVAMGIEPGDAISVSEDVTGVNSVFFVQSYSLDIGEDKTSFSWALQKTAVESYWQMGDVGFSEMDDSTVLAPL